MFTDVLEREFNKAIGQAHAPSTKKLYAKNIQNFEQFCKSIGVRLPKQLCENVLELYIAHLNLKGFAHSTIMSHVSAIRHFNICKNISATLDSPRISLALRGIKNNQPTQQNKTAVSISHLKRLLLTSRQTLQYPAGCRFRAMICLAFFGFLRPSEFCITSAGHELKWGNLKLDKRARNVRLTLPTYKHKQTNDIDVVKIASTGHSYCPIKNINAYLAVYNGRRGTPLFNVTVAEFQSTLKSTCNSAHIKSSLTPHCFRHGGATWASNQGWPDVRIRAHGRWKSSAYKRYVRPF